MNSWVFSFLLTLVNDRSSHMPLGRWLYMNGAATEKQVHKSLGLGDSARHGHLRDVAGPQSPAHRTPGYQVLKAARRVSTIEGLVHYYSKYLVFDDLVDWQPMEFT